MDLAEEILWRRRYRKAITTADDPSMPPKRRHAARRRAERIVDLLYRGTRQTKTTRRSTTGGEPFPF